MSDPHAILSFARIATALLAGIISLLAARAFLRARRLSLFSLALGAGILAGGYLAEGLLVEFVGWSIERATVVESIATLVAAAILVGGLYLKDRQIGAPRAGSDHAATYSPR